MSSLSSFRGRRFGCLTVAAIAASGRWVCECVCGKTCELPSKLVIRGDAVCSACKGKGPPPPPAPILSAPPAAPRSEPHVAPDIRVSDVVYIWRVFRGLHGGLPVFKFGITSAHLGLDRVTTVAKKGRLKVVFVAAAQVEDARRVEKQLLELGVNPNWNVPDGATEFRALTESELKSARQILAASLIGSD